MWCGRSTLRWQPVRADRDTLKAIHGSLDLDVLSRTVPVRPHRPPPQWSAMGLSASRINPPTAAAAPISGTTALLH